MNKSKAMKNNSFQCISFEIIVDGTCDLLLIHGWHVIHTGGLVAAKYMYM